MIELGPTGEIQRAIEADLRDDCREASVDSLANRVAHLEEARAENPTKHEILTRLLSIVQEEIRSRQHVRNARNVDQQIAKHKEADMSGDAEARETCRYPGCMLTVQNRGLCYKHQKDAQAKAEYALPSRRSAPRQRKGPRPAGAVPNVTRPQSRGQAEVPRRPAGGDDLVVAIPRAEVTDDLAALLFRRGARVVG